jgi:hypothetical protein
MIRLLLREIKDTYVRDNFARITDYLKAERALDGFRFRTITFTEAQANFKFPHTLGYEPKDVLVLSKTGAGDITFNYDKFDQTNLDITTTGPVEVRVLVGAYKENV